MWRDHPAALGAQGHSHVVLLLVCDDNIAIFHDGLAFSLPVVSPVTQESAEVAVQLLAEDMGLGDADIGYVGSLGEVQFWRAEVPRGLREFCSECGAESAPAGQRLPAAGGDHTSGTKRFV